MAKSFMIYSWFIMFHVDMLWCAGLILHPKPANLHKFTHAANA